MRSIFAPVIGVVLATSPVSATSPDVHELVQQMKQAFEPTQPSTRKLTIAKSDRKAIYENDISFYGS